MIEENVYNMYELFRGEWVKLFELHRGAFQDYLTFVVAVMGATIAGLIQVGNNNWLGIVLVLGPVLNVILCVLAIRMCNRFYLGALEKVIVMSKLESMLGIQGQIDSNDASRGQAIVFPKDRHFFPERWIKGSQYDTSEEFINRHLNTGVNHLVKRTFQLLIGINIILGVVMLVNVFI